MPRAKLSENGKLGIVICIVAIFLIWGVYLTYLFPILKDLYLPMFATAVIVVIALFTYWVYQVDNQGEK